MSGLRTRSSIYVDQCLQNAAVFQLALRRQGIPAQARLFHPLFCWGRYQMQQEAAPTNVGLRFRAAASPSVAACVNLRRPVTFTHVVSPNAMSEPTIPAPADSVFAVYVHHRPITEGHIWISQRHHRLQPVSDGGVCIFDLLGEPTAQILEPFEFSRFEFPRAALDDLAYEQGVRRLGTLDVPVCGVADPVIKYIALAMRQRMEWFGPQEDTLFRDHLTLALFSHLAKGYAGADGGLSSIGLLAPWQMRRLDEWIEANLHKPISIADLAALVELSPSHFSRVFVRSAGIAPHRWLLRMRIERAKHLLKAPTASLSDVAASCGFVDQSHFTKVFTRVERMTPGRWKKAI